MDVRLTRDEATGTITVVEHTGTEQHSATTGSVDTVELIARLTDLGHTAGIPVTITYQSSVTSTPIRVLYDDFIPTTTKTLRDSLPFTDSGFFNTQDYVDVDYFAEDYSGVVYVF